jgi:hypothetical protein
MRTDRSGPSLAALILALSAHGAAAEAPLSAIDWLSQSLITPVAQPKPPEPGVAEGGALPEDVAVTALDRVSPDGVGILPAQVTGLPRNLWGLGKTNDIIAALQGPGLDALPALQGLMITLLLAEADPPSDAGLEGRLLIARIDRLLAMGALDQARALIDAAGPASSPDLFRRSFDIAILTGGEDLACKTMTETPGLAPAMPARIFCLARSGDWQAAALTLQTAEALGQVTVSEASLLARFLDADLSETELVPPNPVTPLVLKLYEGIGEPLSSSALPLAFSQADLATSTGWKGQIEAAERLVRAGAIGPNLLLGLYTERQPAASGGVWNRVAAFQDFDDALTAGDVAAVAKTLPLAWEAMISVELEVPFATLFADKLAKLPLTGDAAALAFDIALLSPGYERLAEGRTGGDVRETFLIGLAQGSVKGLAPPDSMARAIAPAFTDPVLSAEAQLMVDQLRMGEVMIHAMARVANGVQGDLRGVTEGLSVLRRVGLEDVARRTALELMLLERRG